MPTYYHKIYNKKGEDNYLKTVEHYKENEKVFFTETTKTTKKIIANGNQIIFNEDGKQDVKLLHLIKEVRKDAIEFEEMQFFEPKEYKINWFNTLFGLDYEDEFEVIKIDLKSAYWETAKMMGLISEKTDKLLHQYFPIDTDKIKHKKSRLVSIGSLATVKKLQLFQEGKPIHTAETRQPTRGLFFEICSTVDNFMNEIIERVNKVNNDRIVYYYWDCFFIIDNPHNEKEVVNEIRKGGYDCSVEKGILKMDAINKNIQVTTRKDCNTYPYHLQKQPNIYTPVNGYIDNVIDKMPKGKIKLFA